MVCFKNNFLAVNSSSGPQEQEDSGAFCAEYGNFVLQKYENLSKLDTSSPLSLFIVAIMAFS
jgi:hypothetical protein